MKIKKAKIYKIELPVIAPFRTGFGTVSSRVLLFLKLYDNSGLIGIGEASNMELPLYEPEFNDATISLLKNYLVPIILHKNITTIDQLQDIFNTVKGFNFAKAIIESCFWHLESQRQNKPLRKLWGGEKTCIPASISIGLGVNLEDSIKKVKISIEKFHPKRAKIKIKPGIDIKLIKEIRKSYPTLPLLVDANASYSFKDEQLLVKLDEFNLIMIEQPFSGYDLVNHAQLQKKIKTPICLDESINCYHDAEQAISLKACQIINIKPQRVGGYWNAKLISELCSDNQIPVWCGGMLESGWGQLFNCHISTLANFKHENDICLTKWYLADDILAQPIEEMNGEIDIASTDNLFNINKDKFAKYTKEKLIIK